MSPVDPRHPGRSIRKSMLIEIMLPGQEANIVHTGAAVVTDVVAVTESEITGALTSSLPGLHRKRFC